MLLEFSRRANRDLHEIRIHIALERPVSAKRVVGAIRNACKGLPLNPLVGRARDELLPGHRSIIVGMYSVFYRVTDRAVQITHIIHQSRDLPTALK